MGRPLKNKKQDIGHWLDIGHVCPGRKERWRKWLHCGQGWLEANLQGWGKCGFFFGMLLMLMLFSLSLSFQERDGHSLQERNEHMPSLWLVKRYEEERKKREIGGAAARGRRFWWQLRQRSGFEWNTYAVQG